LLTHVEALELDRIPDHLLVIGGGCIGAELSRAMRRFGGEVSVIDRNGRLTSKEDEHVCQSVRDLLEDEGIDMRAFAELPLTHHINAESVR
jgi:pyruvate/2-oxoglutarate dehydrogenase complex dihydrolipoamide dehydrogenase (E3) component